MADVLIDPDIPADPQANVPEAARNPFLDLLLEHWPRIASVAWEGHRCLGRGTVLVRDGSVPPALTYRPGAPCPCHEDTILGYDPASQVVIAVVDAEDDVRWLQVLSGWPTPACAPACVVAGVAERVH